MTLALGFLLLLGALAVLLATLFSIARLEGKHLLSQDIRWPRFLKIYMFGAYCVTGQPIRAPFGIGLTLSTLLLYPVSFLIIHDKTNLFGFHRDESTTLHNPRRLLSALVC